MFFSLVQGAVVYAARLGLNPHQFAAMLAAPAVLHKINVWTQATHSETFWYGEANFNTNYRVTGWGWLFLRSPFPGTTQFWVERLDADARATDSKRFALNPAVNL